MARPKRLTTNTVAQAPGRIRGLGHGLRPQVVQFEYWRHSASDIPSAGFASAGSGLA